MKLTKQDKKLLYFFEDYVDALIDRRTFQISSPESDSTFEDKTVAAARSMLLEEIKK